MTCRRPTAPPAVRSDRPRDPSRRAAQGLAAQRAADANREAELRERACEGVPWLHPLGFRADEARRAAETVTTREPDAPFQGRVKLAIATPAPRGPKRAGARAEAGASG